ncbi:MAG: T9SS type A sorting domain-containing protein [Bacteroidota bacterium]
MKTIFTTLLLVIHLFLSAQLYNSPESVEYDAPRNRYIVASTNGGGNLYSVVLGNAPSFFTSAVSSPYGLCIVGDSVYVCDQSSYIKVYNLITGAAAGSINTGGSFLNGICTDFAGNIYATDFSSTPKKIYRMSIATQQFNTFVTNIPKTPNGIVWDPFHNRLVVATWGTNASLLGVNMSDSTITTIKTTAFTNIDGITIDEDGNFYIAEWGGDKVYFFDSALLNPPLQVVSGLGNPADISYNQLRDTLVVPNTTLNTVTFHGFPRPIPTTDFDTVAVSYLKTICVLQNDLISGNGPLTLQSFSSPQLGSAVASGNCIDYTSTNTGNDTITYVVCSVDTPSFCRTGTLFVTNVASGGNQAPLANDDTASSTQPNPVIVNVAANDVDAIGDTLCITSITGSNFFSLDTSNCANIIFTPDSFFVGNDTCVYVICDNGTPALCDTAMLVVTAYGGLPPTADFVVSFGNFNCYSFTTINTSIGDTGTAVWIFSPQFTASATLYGDTGYYLNFNMHGFYGEVCLYVSNHFGKDTLCETYNYICEGIEENLLSNIHFFPNPATNILTIDMQNNQDEITRSYAAIEIFNALGEKQSTVLRKGAAKVVSMNVSDLPQGVYLAIIVSDKNERKMLGRFTVNR